jgi:hypothetical protein
LPAVASHVPSVELLPHLPGSIAIVLRQNSDSSTSELPFRRAQSFGQFGDGRRVPLPRFAEEPLFPLAHLTGARFSLRGAATIQTDNGSEFSGAELKTRRKDLV